MIQKILHYQHRVTGEFLFETLKRYFLFVFGGLIGWVMLIGIHEFLQKQSGLHPAFSYGLGIIAADVFTFTYHSLITFRIKTGWQIRLMEVHFPADRNFCCKLGFVLRWAQHPGRSSPGYCYELFYHRLPVSCQFHS